MLRNAFHFNESIRAICAAKSNLALGFRAMAGLFCACFFLIHIFRWATAYFLENKRGNKRKNAEPPPAPPQKQAEKKPKPAADKSDKPPEKIYYIVEKKKKRESSKYSEPKEFRFK